MSVDKEGGFSIADIVAAPALIRKAEKALNQATQAAPTDPELYRQLGQLYRRRGDLEAAAEAFAKWAALAHGDQRAAYSSAIFSGNPLPFLRETGLHAAPFVQIKSFLPKSRRQEVLDYVIKKEDYFEPSLDQRQNPEKRNTLALPDLGNLKPILEGWLTDVARSSFARLGLQHFDISRIETKFTNHLDGCFFRHHQDVGRNQPTVRRISYLYYFHRAPKRFEGGDLLLCDSDTFLRKYNVADFTRIEPVDNSLVLFPSADYHARHQWCYVHETLPTGALRSLATSMNDDEGWSGGAHPGTRQRQWRSQEKHSDNSRPRTCCDGQTKNAPSYSRIGSTISASRGTCRLARREKQMIENPAPPLPLVVPDERQVGAKKKAYEAPRLRVIDAAEATQRASGPVSDGMELMTCDSAGATQKRREFSPRNALKLARKPNGPFP